MNIDRFIENIVEQIKEVQLKLGYAKEVIRLFFPVQSLCSLLQVQYKNGEEMLTALEQEKGFSETELGTIRFSLCKNDRIEVCIAPEGADYVHDNVTNPPFLASIIDLFKSKHVLMMLMFVKRWNLEQILIMYCTLQSISRIHGIIASGQRWGILFITGLARKIIIC